MSEASGATAALAAPAGGDGGTQAAQVNQGDAAVNQGTEAASTPQETNETTSEKQESEAKPKRKTPKEWAKEALEQDFDDDDSADEYVRTEVVNSRKLNKQLMEYFDENPEVGAAVSKALKDGVPFATAMAAYMTPEEYAEAVELSDGGKEAMKARKEQLAQQKEHEALVAKNRTNSEKTVAEFAKENNIDDAELGGFFNETVVPMFQSLINQDLNKKMLTALWKAHRFDKEVSEAEQIGALRTANQKIKTEKENIKGDGLPVISGGSKANEPSKKAVSSISRVAQEHEEQQKRIS